MNLVVIGVNHKTAPVALRERLAFAPDDRKLAGQSLSAFTRGHVMISTCNRMEIYALVDETTDALHAPSNNTAPESILHQLSQWLATNRHVPLTRLMPHLYFYDNSQALSHWLRVASGLDSMILGEPQIFGQIKQAVSHAEDDGNLSKPLGWLAQQVFAGAKQVRHDTKVGTQAVSLGFASAKLVTQIFDDPTSLTLLVVASGEMNRLVATHLCEMGIDRVLICNRSLERATALAEELKQGNRQVSVHALDELPELLPQADVVSSCSGSMHALIHKKMVKTALKKRRHQPMLMVDLAVPRDIEPDVGKLDDVYLYSIDDLQHVIAGNLEKRRQAAVEAELLVSQLVVDIGRRWQIRQVGQDIFTYRQTAQHKAQALLAEALQQLNHPEHSPEVVLTELTHRLTQTLTHPPTQLMRDIASTGDVQNLATVVDGLTDAYRPDKAQLHSSNSQPHQNKL